LFKPEQRRVPLVLDKVMVSLSYLVSFIMRTCVTSINYAAAYIRTQTPIFLARSSDGRYRKKAPCQLFTLIRTTPRLGRDLTYGEREMCRLEIEIEEEEAAAEETEKMHRVQMENIVPS
jgi:hypothetical protein